MVQRKDTRVPRLGFGGGILGAVVRRKTIASLLVLVLIPTAFASISVRNAPILQRVLDFGNLAWTDVETSPSDGGPAYPGSTEFLPLDSYDSALGDEGVAGEAQYQVPPRSDSETSTGGRAAQSPSGAALSSVKEVIPPPWLTVVRPNPILELRRSLVTDNGIGVPDTTYATLSNPERLEAWRHSGASETLHGPLAQALAGVVASLRDATPPHATYVPSKAQLDRSLLQADRVPLDVQLRVAKLLDAWLVSEAFLVESRGMLSAEESTRLFEPLFDPEAEFLGIPDLERKLDQSKIAQATLGLLTAEAEFVAATQEVSTPQLVGPMTANSVGPVPLAPMVPESGDCRPGEAVCLGSAAESGAGSGGVMGLFGLSNEDDGIVGDYLITIDLGGNDTHVGHDAVCEVSVCLAIDVAGDDFYHPDPESIGSIEGNVRQAYWGVSDIGGVATFIDAGGNDRYLLDLPAPEIDFSDWQAVGRMRIGPNAHAGVTGSAGYGAYGLVFAQEPPHAVTDDTGVALFMELGGDDRYSIMSPFYRGEGSGLGQFVDLQGNDCYRNPLGHERMGVLVSMDVFVFLSTLDLGGWDTYHGNVDYNEYFREQSIQVHKFGSPFPHYAVPKKDTYNPLVKNATRSMVDLAVVPCKVTFASEKLQLDKKTQIQSIVDGQEVLVQGLLANTGRTPLAGIKSYFVMRCPPTKPDCTPLRVPVDGPSSLEAQQNVTLSYTWTTPPATEEGDTYELGFETESPGFQPNNGVGPSSGYADENPVNNLELAQLDVHKYVPKVNVRMDSMRLNPNIVRLGAPVQIRISLSNLGDVPAEAVPISLSLEKDGVKVTDLVGTISGSLPIAEGRGPIVMDLPAISRGVPDSVDFGRYSIRVEALVPNDGDPSDNVKTVDLWVGAATPDFQASFEPSAMGLKRACGKYFHSHDYDQYVGGYTADDQRSYADVDRCGGWRVSGGYWVGGESTQCCQEKDSYWSHLKPGDVNLTSTHGNVMGILDLGKHPADPDGKAKFAAQLLQSPALDLTKTVPGPLQLSFWTYISTPEDLGVNFFDADERKLSVLVRELDNEYGYSYTGAGYFCTAQAHVTKDQSGQRCPTIWSTVPDYMGPLDYWHRVTVDLTQFQGKKINIQFYDPVGTQVTWLIDDVTIVAPGGPEAFVEVSKPLAGIAGDYLLPGSTLNVITHVGMSGLSLMQNVKVNVVIMRLDTKRPIYVFSQTLPLLLANAPLSQRTLTTPITLPREEGIPIQIVAQLEPPKGNWDPLSVVDTVPWAYIATRHNVVFLSGGLTDGNKPSIDSTIGHPRSFVMKLQNRGNLPDDELVDYHVLVGGVERLHGSLRIPPGAIRTVTTAPLVPDRAGAAPVRIDLELPNVKAGTLNVKNVLETRLDVYEKISTVQIPAPASPDPGTWRYAANGTLRFGYDNGTYYPSNYIDSVDSDVFEIGPAREVHAVFDHQYDFEQNFDGGTVRLISPDSGEAAVIGDGQAVAALGGVPGFTGKSDGLLNTALRLRDVEALDQEVVLLRETAENATAHMGEQYDRQRDDGGATIVYDVTYGANYQGWSRSHADAHGGSFTWFNNNMLRTRLITAEPIDLTDRDFSSAQLTFWHHYSTYKAILKVEARAFGSPTWKTILPLSGYPGGFDYYSSTGGGGEEWARAAFDLSQFLGQRIQVAFHVDSQVVGGVVNAKDGIANWYVDDIEIKGSFWNGGSAKLSFLAASDNSVYKGYGWGIEKKDLLALPYVSNLRVQDIVLPQNGVVGPDQEFTFGVAVQNIGSEPISGRTIELSLDGKPFYQSDLGTIPPHAIVGRTSYPQLVETSQDYAADSAPDSHFVTAKILGPSDEFDYDGERSERIRVTDVQDVGIERFLVTPDNQVALGEHIRATAKVSNFGASNFTGLTFEVEARSPSGHSTVLLTGELDLSAGEQREFHLEFVPTEAGKYAFTARVELSGPTATEFGGAAGKEVASNNQAIRSIFSQITRPSIKFNFESGNAGWTAVATQEPAQAAGVSVRPGGFRLAKDPAEYPYAHTSPAFWTNADAVSRTYRNVTDESLVSPVLDLSNAGSGSRFTFLHRFSFRDPMHADVGHVEVSTDNGITWQTVEATHYTQVRNLADSRDGVARTVANARNAPQIGIVLAGAGVQLAFELGGETVNKQLNKSENPTLRHPLFNVLPEGVSFEDLQGIAEGAEKGEFYYGHESLCYCFNYTYGGYYPQYVGSWPPSIPDTFDNQLQNLSYAYKVSEKAPMLRGFTGTSAGWTLSAVDLAPYLGQQVRFRLHFTSDAVAPGYPSFLGCNIFTVTTAECGYPQTDSAINDNVIFRSEICSFIDPDNLKCYTDGIDYSLLYVPVEGVNTQNQPLRAWMVDDVAVAPPFAMNFETVQRYPISDSLLKEIPIVLKATGETTDLVRMELQILQPQGTQLAVPVSLAQTPFEILQLLDSQHRVVDKSSLIRIEPDTSTTFYIRVKTTNDQTKQPGSFIVRVIAEPSASSLQTVGDLRLDYQTVFKPNLRLRAGSFKSDPKKTPGEVGVPASLTALVENVGYVPSPPTVVRLIDSTTGTTLQDLPIGGLQSFATGRDYYVPIAFNSSFPEASLYYLQARIDPLNLILENNETDNLANLIFPVGPAIEPDLAILSATPEVSEADLGTDVAVTVIVQNRGNIPVKGARLLVFVGGTNSGEYPLPELGVGAEIKYSSYIAAVPGGAIRIQALVEAPGDLHPENDRVFAELFVRNFAMTLELPTEPFRVQPGSLLEVPLRINNLGNQEDQFFLRVLSSPEGTWTAIEPGEIQLAPGTNANGTLRTEVPPTLAVGNHTIKLLLTSESSSAVSVTGTVVLQVLPKATNPSTILAPSHVNVDGIGEIHLDFTNSGAASVSLRWGSKTVEGWRFEFSPSAAVVGSGAHLPVTVRVVPPDPLVPGSYALVGWAEWKTGRVEFTTRLEVSNKAAVAVQNTPLLRIEPGGDATIPVRIRNLGALAISWTVATTSADPGLRPTWQTTTGGIDSKSETIANLTIRVDPETPTGVYDLSYLVHAAPLDLDVPGWLSVSVEKPQLELNLLDTSPKIPRPGRLSVSSFEIENTGLTPSLADSVDVWVGQTKVGSAPIPELGPGETRTVQVSWWMPKKAEGDLRLIPGNSTTVQAFSGDMQMDLPEAIRAKETSSALPGLDAWAALTAAGAAWVLFFRSNSETRSRRPKK